MAIKIKKPAPNGVPAALDAIADVGFRASVLEKHFKEIAGDRRGALKAYCEHNDDGFDLTEKTIACTNGKITLVERSKYDVDVEQIQEMIENGDVTLTTILQCVSFRASDLQTALGARFNEVATNAPSQSFTFKPSAGFKADVIGSLESDDRSDTPAPAAPAKKAAKKKPAAKMSVAESLERAKKADAQNNGTDDVEADLGQMLGNS